MSYRILPILTLLFIMSHPGSLDAQRPEVTRELPQLASPAAWKRATAVARIAAIEGDIAADLRLAYRTGDALERVGLLEVAQLRADGALVSQAATALSDADERVSGASHAYLMSLSFGDLKPELSGLTEGQKEGWQQFVTYRIRRDVSIALLRAYLMPGKFFGQFDELRKFDSTRLDEELMHLLYADAGFVDAINAASLELLDQDVPPERIFQSAFRRLQSGAGAFKPVLDYNRDLELSKELEAEISRTSRSRFQAALDVFANVRAAAARALADTRNTAEVRLRLEKFYDEIKDQRPTPELSHLVNLEGVLIEAEVTLARFGSPTLLDARISVLRGQIERVQQAKVNVNMNAGSRPDLIAQNEIAHLLLRSGRLENAELEWSNAADAAVNMMRTAEGRNRSSLSSYLGALYYNLACAQSLQLKSDKALVSLRKAVEHGYKDFAWMLEDGDLYEVRHHPDFSTWFQKAAPPSIADRLRDSD